VEGGCPAWGPRYSDGEGCRDRIGDRIETEIAIEICGVMCPQDVPNTARRERKRSQFKRSGRRATGLVIRFNVAWA
jgi:hypothetical protein